MSQQARVRSIDAVRQFRVELDTYAHALTSVVQLLIQECHRGVEWVESDRMVYWPAQVRRASDELSEARVNLESCMVKIRPEDRAPCTEQKKAFESAKRRLRLCEEKVQITRAWLHTLRRQADDFRTAMAKATHVAEVELPQALARLDEIIAKLEAYL